ncbi:sulfatase-like hydrolase/transferase [Streptomyces achromogenes]|uniref:sulfatase-like hydrolase/transferase n=1 Tax=Streptomyces achromogenes TaxID=67255 RepID=UPI0036A2A598
MSSTPLSRRGVLAASAASLAAAALPAGAARATAGAHGQDRPNILWLVAEDHNPLLGSYRDAQARTPHLDAFAAQGVRYENSFSTYPVCAPTRFSIITGVDAESCGPAHQMRAVGNRPDWLRAFPEYLREAGYYTSNNSKTDYNAGYDLNAVWDDCSGTASYLGRSPGQPFFSVFNDEITHEMTLWYPATGPTGVHDPDDAVIPAYLPDNAVTRKDRAHYYDNITRVDARFQAKLTALEAAGLAENTIVFFYSDNGGVLPRTKRYAYDSGLRTALLVRYPEKWQHLAPAAPGSVITDPVTSLDYAPTVLELAGVERPQHLRGASLLARRGRPKYAFGARNRMDERYDFVRTVRDTRYRYIRNYQPHRIQGQHGGYEWQQLGYQEWERAHLAGELNEIQERFWQEKPAEELYDLATDPDEVHNLIDAPHLRSVRNRLAKALDEHILAVHDNGFIPESSAAEGYDQSRVPGAFPIRRVKALADKAIQRHPRNIQEFLHSLRDDNEIIRYWAVQGLQALLTPATAELKKKHVTEALEKVLADTTETPQVKIPAAETLARLDHPDRAVPYLANTVATSTDSRVQLQAVNALTYIPHHHALPALDALETTKTTKSFELLLAVNYLRLVLKGEYAPTPAIQAKINAAS